MKFIRYGFLNVKVRESFAVDVVYVC